MVDLKTAMNNCLEIVLLGSFDMCIILTNMDKCGIYNSR